MPGRRPPRGLAPEDLELWESVTRTAKPLKPPRRAGVTVPAPTVKRQADPAPPHTPVAPLRLPERLGGRSSVPSGSNATLRADIADEVRAAPLRMDRKRFVAMARGKADPQARIDLHGMTLAQAHGALAGFILRAHRDGLRLVLVITGKGAGPDAETAGADAPHGLRPRGALRRQVPQWLAMAPMAGAVLQIAPAHRRHGGLGAYYVYLRRSRA